MGGGGDVLIFVFAEFYYFLEIKISPICFHS